jgi:hypothetical protein
MIVIKTTDEIFKNVGQGITITTLTDAPAKEHLSNDKFIPNINNVKLWEQIFYKKNYAGIYAAWSPYVEFYILVYEPLIGTEYSYETFFGANKNKELISKAKRLNIDLKEQFMWVDNLDAENFNRI